MRSTSWGSACGRSSRVAPTRTSRSEAGRTSAAREIALGGERNLRRAFAQGIVVNVLNPKTALFFLAFLPQFVDPNAAHPALQIAFLGVLFALLGLVTDSIWAIAAGSAGGVLRRSRRFVRTQRYVTGTVYVGLGVATALGGGTSED